MKQALTLPVEFETIKSTLERKAHLQRMVSWAPQWNREPLLSKLKYCCESNPCGSGACPTCNRLFREQLHTEAVQAAPMGSEFLAVSLIHKDSRVKVGSLDHFDLARWAESRQRGIARATPKDAVVIGGVDISLNTMNNDDAHWCFHLYVFIALPAGWGLAYEKHRNALREKIEKHNPVVPLSERVGAERPLVVGVRTYDEFVQNVLYSHKGDFYRRSRYAYNKRKTGEASTNVRACFITALRRV